MVKEIRDDLKYTDSHEWIKVEEEKVIIGITDHAQSELTDIVFAELPVIGKEIKKGDELCVVESVKSVSEINSPISGKIINVNRYAERVVVEGINMVTKHVKPTQAGQEGKIDRFVN